MSIKVHNINGTSDNKCKCGSWEKHWEEFNEFQLPWPSRCSEKDCLNFAELGAHVQKEDGSSSQWYIIPLCREHNACRGESIEVRDDTSFASANRGKTCGY